MLEWLSFLFLVVGSVFIFISAIGILKFQDLYMRMHSTTKTTSFGITLLLIGGFFAFPELNFFIKSILTIIFVFLTTPVGTHMISKAGHIMGIRKATNYVRDDWENG
jgi:multicomponent Na+:H+ antiporter subunit G